MKGHLKLITSETRKSDGTARKTPSADKNRHATCIVFTGTFGTLPTYEEHNVQSVAKLGTFNFQGYSDSNLTARLDHTSFPISAQCGSVLQVYSPS